MISFLIASACLVFVLSLPISATKAGQTLRRWAGVLFLLALAPALFVGLVRHERLERHAPGRDRRWWRLSGALGTALGFLILSPLAYGILQLRKRFNPESRDPWADYVDRKAAWKKVEDPKAAKPVLPGGTFGPFGGSP